MDAKEKRLAGDLPAARVILQEAYAAIPDSEEIWLAAFKLEFENQEPERARIHLAKAREKGGTERGWMKSAIVERELGNTTEERRLLQEGLERFPLFFKLWLMFGQMEDRLGHAELARKAYESGLKHCPACTPLWLSLASLEERISAYDHELEMLKVIHHFLVILDAYFGNVYELDLIFNLRKAYFNIDEVLLVGHIQEKTRELLGFL